jgi:hypothetical protein
MQSSEHTCQYTGHTVTRVIVRRGRKSRGWVGRPQSAQGDATFSAHSGASPHASPLTRSTMT